MMPTSTGFNEPTGQVTWTSEELLKGTSEVIITHQGARYRLKQTKNGKLILTK
jgi:hemin uptake protein HemP